MPLSDADLVGRVLAGSEGAFRDLVRRYERRVYAVVLRILRNPATAEELTQEAFLRAFSRLDRYDRRRPFAPWLFRLAHNLTIDALRRSEPALVSYDQDAPAGPPRADSLASSDPSPEAVAAERELARALDEAIGRLRPAYREVIVLQFQEGLSLDDIAEITELPLGTIKTYLHRARKELAGHLAAGGWAR
ncbi:MAG TPA: sigma-70 family RNA polymerase sigma factor [Vicinamibacterales bacterium]